MLRASGSGADGQMLRVTRYEHARGDTDFELGRDRNILLGCDSFVSVAPARGLPATAM